MMPLTIQEAGNLLTELQGWALSPDAKMISKKYTFKDFAEALSFANIVGAIAEEENHHPDIEIGWGKVLIKLATHSIGGLSENDFIVASKIDHA